MFSTYYTFKGHTNKYVSFVKAYNKSVLLVCIQHEKDKIIIV
jgi:hypothetical protein